MTEKRGRSSQEFGFAMLLCYTSQSMVADRRVPFDHLANSMPR